MSAIVLPRPTTKQKQRDLLRVCIDELLKDEHVKLNHDPVIRQLQEILFQLHNRKSPPADVVSVPMTPRLARLIRKCHEAHPRWAYQRLAARYSVNIGRISEAIRGKRI